MSLVLAHMLWLDYVDQIMMFAAGGCAIAVGLAPTAHEADPARRDRTRNIKNLMRVIGPALMAIAVVLAIAKYNGVG